MLAVVCAAGMLFTAMAAGGGQAFAAPEPRADESITVAITRQTGTPDWDSLDANDTNDLVRTNDNVVWTVSTTMLGAQTGAKITVQVPKGMEVSGGIPQFCDAADSSLTPASVPAPAKPLTGTSWESLPQQVLVCGIPSQYEVDHASTQFPLAFTARAEVPNGTELTGSITVSSDQTADVTNPIDVTVVSAPMYDISKNGLWDSPNKQGFVNQPAACFWDSSVACFSVTYPITVMLPSGSKGVSPATSFTFTDDLSPQAFYGVSGITDLAKYGARFNNVAMNSQAAGIPYSNVGGSRTLENSARDTGTVSCSQAGGPGTEVSCTVSGGDYSAYTHPSLDVAGNPLPDANKAVVAEFGLNVHIPDAATLDYGVLSSGSWTLRLTNELTDFGLTDIAGQGLPAGADDPSNNERDVNRTITPDGGFTKRFAGVPGDAWNTKPVVFQPGTAGDYWDGPAGNIAAGSGDGLVFPGTNVISGLAFETSGSADPRTFVACDYWDSAHLNLQAKSYPSSGRASGGQITPSDGAAVWVSGNFYGTGYIADPGSAHAQILQVWYSNDSKAAAGQDCGGDDVTWYSSPTDPGLGNDPGLVSQGIYTGVNMVRVALRMDGSTVGRSIAWLSIGLRVADDAPVGTMLGNWESAMSGLNTTPDALIANGTYALSTYDLAAGTGYPRGDRVTVTGLQVSVNKQVLQTENQGGAWTDQVTQTSVGQRRSFRLQPVLSSAVAGAPSSNVRLEDCIPAGFDLVSSSVPYSLTSDSASELSCDSGTYVRWDLGPQTAGSTIPAVTYDVTVSPSVGSGTYTNTAVVSAVGDASSLAMRTDTQQVQVLNPSGIYVEKSVASPQVQVNRSGQGTNEKITWSVSSYNIGPVGGKANLDMIDIFPANGVDPAPCEEGAATCNGHTAPASSFSGTLSFAGVSKASGADAEVWYTTVPAGQLSLDPQAAVNSTGAASSAAPLTVNSATWKLAASLSDVPANATGLRFRSNGLFEADDAFSYSVVFEPTGDAAGDLFVNSMDALISDVQPGDVFVSASLLGKTQSQVNAVAATVGDLVWNDANGNGIQDSGEKGVGGVKVTLTGTDDLGNAVSLTTTTDGDGKYSFTGLRASDDDGYTVTVARPAGTLFTAQNKGTDDAVDSDVTPSTGKMTAVLTAGQDNPTLDAGIYTPVLTVAKVSDKPVEVRAGDTITYTVTGTNNGPGNFTGVVSAVVVDDLSKVTDDATFNDDAKATIDGADAGAVTVGSDDRLVWSGPLAKGKSVTITYTVTVKPDADRGDSDLLNTAFTPGTTSGCAADDTDCFEVPPPDECTEGSCAQVDHKAPALVVAKTSDKPVEVRAGDTVTYTVTGTNNGPGDFTADTPALLVDDLSKVTDDATFNDDAKATVDGADVGPVTVGSDGRLVWTGALAVSKSVVITYTVTVKADGDRGDSELLNTAFVPSYPPGEPFEPGTPEFPDTPTGPECAAPTCATVEHDVPALAVEKTSDKETISVVPGDIVTYTVTGTNNGPGDFTADMPALLVDDLSKVTDDATFNDDAKATIDGADAGAVTVGSDGRLVWTGPLAADKSVVITYTVTVKADGERGDSKLLNTAFVPAYPPEEPFNPGDPKFPETPTGPACAAPTCDTVNHEVPNISLVKDGVLADGDTGRPGDTVEFTFTIVNDGPRVLHDVHLVDDKPGLSKIVYGPWPEKEGVLKPGETVTATATYVVTEEDVVVGNVPNTATAIGTDDDGTKVDSTSKVKVPLVVNPAIDLTKTVEQATGDTKAPRAGDTLRYTFTVTNTGDISLVDVTVTDPLPGLSAITWEAWPAVAGHLAPGESVVGHATYTLTDADVRAGKVVNKAIATGHIPGWKPGDPTPPSIASGVPNPEDPAEAVFDIPVGLLAFTGATAGPLAVVAGVLLLAGVGLLIWSRKRREA